MHERIRLHALAFWLRNNNYIWLSPKVTRQSKVCNVLPRRLGSLSIAVSSFFFFLMHFFFFFLHSEIFQFSFHCLWKLSKTVCVFSEGKLKNPLLIISGFELCLLAWIMKNTTAHWTARWLVQNSWKMPRGHKNRTLWAGYTEHVKVCKTLVESENFIKLKVLSLYCGKWKRRILLMRSWRISVSRAKLVGQITSVLLCVLDPLLIRIGLMTIASFSAERQNFGKSILVMRTL